jgi:glycosyltransferase involved in cell wall biosynthesis
MRLSILIATVPERRRKFHLLSMELERQAEGLPVQIVPLITERASKGGPSIGKKRQDLLLMAKGEYVTFIDDDDWIDSDYIQLILEAIGSGPDCIGFLVSVQGLARKPQIASASNEWQGWADNIGGFDYVRTIYHKNPVKRDIALQIGYNDLKFGEDHDYSVRLKQSGLLKTEVFIDRPLYIYRYRHEHPRTKYGM